MRWVTDLRRNTERATLTCGDAVCQRWQPVAVCERLADFLRTVRALLKVPRIGSPTLKM